MTRKLSRRSLFECIVIALCGNVLSRTSAATASEPIRDGATDDWETTTLTYNQDGKVTCFSYRSPGLSPSGDWHYLPAGVSTPLRGRAVFFKGEGWNRLPDAASTGEKRNE